jgi:hypothetical protein
MSRAERLGAAVDGDIVQGSDLLGGEMLVPLATHSAPRSGPRLAKHLLDTPALETLPTKMMWCSVMHVPDVVNASNRRLRSVFLLGSLRT